MLLFGFSRWLRPAFYLNQLLRTLVFVDRFSQEPSRSIFFVPLSPPRHYLPRYLGNTNPMPTGSLVGGSFAGGPFPSAKHRSNIDPMTRGGGKRKSFEGSSRSPAKRRRESVSDDGGYNNDDSDDDEDDDEGDDDADAETTEYKRVGGGVSTEESPTRKDPAKPGPVQPLSCPFRKRNPKRFNFLDHFQCTRAFKSLSLVKSVHPAPLQVPH